MWKWNRWHIKSFDQLISYVKWLTGDEDYSAAELRVEKDISSWLCLKGGNLIFSFASLSYSSWKFEKQSNRFKSYQSALCLCVSGNWHLTLSKVWAALFFWLCFQLEWKCCSRFTVDMGRWNKFRLVIWCLNVYLGIDEVKGPRNKAGAKSFQKRSRQVSPVNQAFDESICLSNQCVERTTDDSVVARLFKKIC